MVSPSMLNLQQGSINLNVSPEGTGRMTSNIDFSAQLRKVMANGAHAASKAASTAAPLIPGAAVMSAVLSNAANDLAGAGGGGMMSGASGQNGNFLQTMEGMQQNMMSMNMQMISVQREFQQMSEQYTMVSNVMKTKHDAEKNAISNIR